MRKLFIILAAGLGLLALVGAAIVGTAAIMVMPWAQSSGPRPSDAAMIAHFEKHRADFEQLAAMMREDARLKRIGKDFAQPDNAVGTARLAQYRALLARLNIISVSHYGSQIEFVYYTQGITIRGSAKSFCFGPPPDFVEEIDGDLDAAWDTAVKQHERGMTFQRRIAGDWWLQYEGT